MEEEVTDRQNPMLKTTMTTNIRNIMRPQEKTFLTQTNRYTMRNNKKITAY